MRVGTLLVRAMTAALAVLAVAAGTCPIQPATVACAIVAAPATGFLAYDRCTRCVAQPDRRTLVWVVAAVGALALLACVVVAGLVVLAGQLVAAAAALIITGLGACWLACAARPTGAAARVLDGVKWLWLPQPHRPRSLPQMSLAELCRMWRRSTSALALVWAHPERLAVLLDQRRRCLDELAHRDPVGFARWLESGHQARSDPAQYLSEPLHQASADGARSDGGT